MGDLLQFPTRYSEETTEYLILLTDDIMARNKGAISWLELSREDEAEIDRINEHWLDDFNKAAKMGLISKEHADKINNFIAWTISLGGQDT
jgi:hypothetical protein